MGAASRNANFGSVCCTCKLHAMFSQCPHELFVRALPWKCRSSDVDLFPYSSRSELSRAVRQKAGAPISKAKARGKARALTLAEFFPSRKRAVNGDKSVSEAQAATETAVPSKTSSQPPLKKFRRLKDWEGHWLRCDACNAWIKATQAEVDTFRPTSFVCAQLGFACKNR